MAAVGSGASSWPSTARGHQRPPGDVPGAAGRGAGEGVSRVGRHGDHPRRSVRSRRRGSRRARFATSRCALHFCLSTRRRHPRLARALTPRDSRADLQSEPCPCDSEMARP
jgi:hypothetical protein